VLHKEKCYITRLLDPFKLREEYATILRKAKLLNVKIDYILIDDATKDFLAVLNVLSKCHWPLNTGKNTERLLNTVRILLDFKVIKDRAESIKASLKKQFNEELYEEYLKLVENRDRLLPYLSEIWAEDKEFFSKLFECIRDLNMVKEELAREMLSDRERLKNMLTAIRKKLEELINTDEQNILWTLDFLPHGLNSIDEYSLLEKIISVRDLIKDACSKIFIIDGEEYNLVIRIKEIKNIKIIS
jgi:hypothetical protein